MLKHKRKTSTYGYLICDKCKHEGPGITRLPVDTIRINVGQDNEWETKYTDLCERCLLLFMTSVKDELKIFLKNKIRK